MSEIIIYHLIDPITKETRYVGQTRLHLKDRLSGHIRDAHKKTYKSSKPVNAKKKEWIRELCNQGLRPIILPLAKVDYDQANYWESFYYVSFSACNTLLNERMPSKKTLLEAQLENAYKKVVSKRKFKGVDKSELILQLRLHGYDV